MANNRLAKQERDELSGLDVSGLREQLDTAKKQLWGMRFANGKRQLEKTADLSKALTLPMLFKTVGDAVWGELVTKQNVGFQRRQIQRQHVESLITLASSSSTDDSRMLAAAHQKMLREKLKLAQAIPTLDEYTRLHYTDLAEKVQRQLDAKVNIGGGGGGFGSLFGRPGK